MNVVKAVYLKEDVEKLIQRLLNEPAYQHEDEDYFCGVCAVSSDLDTIPVYEVEVDLMDKVY